MKKEKFWDKESAEWLLNVTKEDFLSSRYREKKFVTRKYVFQKYCDAKQRCENPNNSLFHRYWARGIKVEVSFEDFVSWFLEDYKRFYKVNGLKRPSLSRINNDVGYRLDNIELTTVSANTRELYSRLGNSSPWGTKLDEFKLLTCLTMRGGEAEVAYSFGVCVQAVRAVNYGRNWKNFHKTFFGGVE